MVKREQVLYMYYSGLSTQQIYTYMYMYIIVDAVRTVRGLKEHATSEN